MTDLSRLQQSCQSKCSTDIYSKNIGMDRSSVSVNYGNNNGTVTGSVWGDLGIGALDTATNLFAMAIIGKMASGETASSPKNVSASVAQDIATLPGAISTSTASFNAKYQKAGIKLDKGDVIDITTGQKVTYKGLTESINQQINSLEQNTISDEKSGAIDANYKAYSDMKTTVSNLKLAEVNIKACQDNIDNLAKLTDMITISGTEAKPNEQLSPAELKMCQDSCSKGQDYKTTNTYKGIIEARQAKADAYNKAVAEKKAACENLYDHEGKKITADQLDDAIQRAETALSSLGSKPLGKSKTTCEANDKKISDLKARLAVLSDFTSEAQAIKDMQLRLSNALQVRSEETDVDEANNRVKANKKKGSLLHRLFGKKSQANKDARANRAIQVAQRDAAYAAYAEKWFK